MPSKQRITAPLDASNLVALNEKELRAGLLDDISGVFGASAFLNVADLVNGESVASALKRALQQNLTRVVDLFHEWDEDRNGKISKSECVASRVLLNHGTPRMHP